MHTEKPYLDTIGTQTPNDRSLYTVSRKDLPLHCPMPHMSLWNAHPRVFLDLERQDEARCPYCGTRYTLRET